MTRNQTRRIVRNLVCVHLMITMLISGCSSRYGRVTKPAREREEITRTHSEFSSMADRSDLPMEYVSEGKIGVSKVEAALEAADAGDLQARAELNRQLAGFSAHRKEVEAGINKTISETEALRKKYKREFSKAMAQVAAREKELEALASQKEAIIASLTKEGESRYNDIVSNAREKFENENARIEQARQIRAALEAESKARIQEMTEASKATRQRAAATVSELEAKALSIQRDTAARAEELSEQIRSAQINTQSEADILRASREALLKDSAAYIKELRAKADTIQANLADEEYQLKLAQAQSLKTETEAKTQEKSAAAPTRFDKAMAEIDRLRAQTRQHQESAVAGYDSGIAEVQARLEDELNEVKKLRVSADRAEQVARAEFVKAEAESRVEAVRQTALHAEAVAEAKKLEIIAEAEAEAARIKQEVLDEIAMKKAAGKVQIDNYTAAKPAPSEDLHKVPETPEVQPVAPRIEPQHIAEYRTRLAEVMRTRAKADAHQLVAEATFAEAQTNLLAVKTQSDAIATEQFAIADALEAQASARFEEIETKMQKEMDVAESTYRQHVAQAESFRKENEAEAQDYRSQALAMEQITHARAEQLLAEAEAVTKCGQKEIEEMEIKLWALQQRGDAQYAKLMTEASSIAGSQEALALQLDAQIAAAGKSLAAELARIDNSIQSAEIIAKADYQESLTQANVLRQKTEAEINRTNAQFTMEYAVSRAQIDRDRNLALSQINRGEAACDRIIADALASKTSENANLDARHAAAQADMNIILADNTAKREAAQSYLDAVKTRFLARVEQVKAERAIDTAGTQFAMAIKRTDLDSALGEAMAARENSNRKLAELQKKQEELQKASLVNWSAKLAVVKNDVLDFEPVQMTTSSPHRDTTPLLKAQSAPLTAPATQTAGTLEPRR